MDPDATDKINKLIEEMLKMPNRRIIGHILKPFSCSDVMNKMNWHETAIQPDQQIMKDGCQINKKQLCQWSCFVDGNGHLVRWEKCWSPDNYLNVTTFSVLFMLH